MNGNFGKVAPVKPGDELDVKIIALGDKGDGIAKKEGFVIVVPGTKKDDEVRIRVTKVFRNVAFGEVIPKTQIENDEQPEEKQELQKDSKVELERQDEPIDTEDFGEDLEQQS